MSPLPSTHNIFVNEKTSSSSAAKPPRPETWKAVTRSRKKARAIAIVLGLFFAGTVVLGCSSGPQATASGAGDRHSQTRSDSSGYATQPLLDGAERQYKEAEKAIMDELEARESAVPIHVALGEEVDVTKNLAVRVVSVEKGPFNHGTNSPTVRVIVEFRNKTDKTLMVKPSNVDADTADGRRIDHKLYVKDENGKRGTRSFLPTSVSPGATFTGAVYFDAEALESVIYEPHFLVSAQSQYVYWDCGQDED